MAINLSRIKEIISTYSSEYVNEKLNKGWILLDVKIVEYSYLISEQIGVLKPYLRKDGKTIYVIGRTK